MTRSEIIELSLQLAERKGERVLNLGALYKFILQDICKRERFWWRRILANFSLTANTKTYDLTNATLFPGLTEIALDEITKFTLITSTNPYQTAELSPTFDPETLVDMKMNTTAATPARYTIDANGYSVLLIDPPDLAYNAYIIGWGMPNPASDTTTDTVPLIPLWGHNTIVLGMVAYLLGFAYGSTNPKAGDAMARYEQAIQDLQQRKKFDPNYVSQMALTESAVRST